MRKRILIACLAIAALFGAAAFGFANQGEWGRGNGGGTNNKQTPNPIEMDIAKQNVDLSTKDFDSSAEPRVQPINATLFLEKDRAAYAWDHAARADVAALRGTPVAGIVNHHALAATFIAGFFLDLKQTSGEDIKRIIVISPDHFKSGRGTISTTDRPYRTDVGTVLIDQTVVQTLVKSGAATLENGTLFEREHGIGALTPFIARAFPNAALIPIAIRGDAPQEAILGLQNELERLSDSRTLIVISADMSHTLAQSAALANDKETMAWFADLKETEVRIAKDDHVDSGKAVAMLFRIFADRKTHPTFHTWRHGISTDFGADAVNTTSYITGVWME